jgi:hypothetical protein
VRFLGGREFGRGIYAKYLVCGDQRYQRQGSTNPGEGGIVRRVGVVRSLAIGLATVVATSSLATLAGAGTVSLSAETLSIDQMPSQWYAMSSGDNGVGCLMNLLEPAGITQTQEAEIFFFHEGGFPFLDEKLATYSNAKKAFKKIASAIASCRNPKGLFKGYEVTGTVSPMSFAKVANASISYSMVFTTQATHATVYYDYVIARKKNVVVAVLEGSYPAVSPTQFSGFVTMALAKVDSTS